MHGTRADAPSGPSDHRGESEPAALNQGEQLPDRDHSDLPNRCLRRRGPRRSRPPFGGNGVV